MHDLWVALQTFWNAQLIQLDAVWITPGRICIGLAAVSVGLWLARLVSRLAVDRMLNGLHVADSRVMALRTIIHYVLIILVFCVALPIAGVPLSVFTVFGGALAIGVGFGSQNILNNFFSGLVILFERPIKNGDLVQIGDKIGIVTKIAGRATALTDYRGITHLIPNSHFLEQGVTNWHYTDDLVCAAVSVGVAYGSDTALVRQLMLQIANAYPKVAATPEPTVLFKDFGNDALIFEVLLYTPSRRVIDRLMVESDIRFALDAIFRKNNIVVAFPQRDVHLDANLPIPVRVVPAAD